MIHQFASGKSDGADGNLVRPSNWNAQHKSEAYSFAFNGSMEIWGAGTSSAPTSWTLSGAGASTARNATNFKRGLYSADLTRSGSDCSLTQDVLTFKGYGPAAWWQNRSVTLGAWVRSSVASRARIAIFDGSANIFSSYHTGGGAFEWLTVSTILAGGTTSVTIKLQVDTGNTTAQFDGVTLTTGFVPSDFVEGGWQGRKCVIAFGTDTIQNQATTEYLGVGGKSATEVQVTFLTPFKGVARNLQALVDSAPAAGQTFTLTYRVGESTDTSLTAQVTSAGRTAQNTTNEYETAASQLVTIKSVASATSGNRYVHGTIEYEEAP